ncbi:hypothetical protein A6X21_09085 [Planctopirus hydrillae]|uniref:Uncharacterized protein n=1 Tax=Planctopirus hydrillae TaxID=1841610 RepID=A0A1C3E7Q1_9PLAN|nr:hypothetical protein A6X21_09085 [Planctopirus hydrillae]
MMNNRRSPAPDQCKCWQCGNIAMQTEALILHCLCTKCGSKNTRCTKEPEKLEQFLELRGFPRYSLGYWKTTIAKDEQSRLAVLLLDPRVGLVEKIEFTGERCDRYNAWTQPTPKRIASFRVG